METTNLALTVEEPDNLHLCFELDGKTYAVSSKHVLEVTTLPLINEPQKLPYYVIGILNYNDLFLNVYDIRKLLNLPDKNFELSNKIIVIKGDESIFAIIVDKVTEFFTIPPSEIQRVMGESYNNITNSFYKIDDKTVNIINTEKLEDSFKNTSELDGQNLNISRFPTDEESVCIMQKRAREIARPPGVALDSHFQSRNQYIIFTLNDHKYCIYSLYIKELLSPKNYQITKIPFTPDFMEGILNLKGNFYTVIDLKKFIGLDDNSPDLTLSSKKIIVIEASELKIALLIDNILDMVNISPEMVNKKNDMTLDNLYIQSEVLLDNEVYNILNIDKLVSDKRLYVNNKN